MSRVGQQDANLWNSEESTAVQSKGQKKNWVTQGPVDGLCMEGHEKWWTKGSDRGTEQRILKEAKAQPWLQPTDEIRMKRED